MHVLWAIASECGTSPRWKLQTGSNKWEHIRYGLETRLLRTPRRHLWSFFAAMRYSDWTTRKFVPSLALTGDTQLGDSERVVLFRKPYPKALAISDDRGGHVKCGVYVPVWFRNNMSTMSEDEKIAASMQSMIVFTKDDLNHPAEYQYSGLDPVPPLNYTCSGCEMSGDHFRHDCSTNTNSGAYKSFDRVQRPHGIPKSLLKTVPEHERGNAMKDDSGNYVVRVKPNSSHM